MKKAAKVKNGKTKASGEDKYKINENVIISPKDEKFAPKQTVSIKEMNESTDYSPISPQIMLLKKGYKNVIHDTEFILNFHSTQEKIPYFELVRTDSENFIANPEFTPESTINFSIPRQQSKSPSKHCFTCLSCSKNLEL